MATALTNTLKKIRFNIWRGYLFAAVLVVLSTWLKELAEPEIIPADVPILYILSIVFTATFFGLGPSILCIVLSLIAYDYFFLAPVHAFTFSIQVWPVLLVFLAVGIIISYLSSRLHKQTDEATREADTRRKSEAELVKYRGHLEGLVKERTSALENLYTDLTEEIAEHKRAEQGLKESEKRLKRAEEIAHLGSWELNLTENTLAWSDEIYRIFGLKPGEFGATYEAFLDNVHPDDRAAVDEAYAGSVREGRDGYEIEHRIIRKDNGEVRYVHEKCQHVKDESGKILRSLGMVHDVTERKKAERALKESEERFRAIAEDSPILIAVSRVSDNSILFTNRTYNEAFGFADGELIGQKAPDVYVDPEDRKLLIQILGEQGFLANYEARVKQADGTPFWVSTSARKIQFGGEPAILGASIDITDRKEIEEALQQSYDELETRVQKRTAELAEVNKSLGIEITEHKLARESVNAERRRFNEVLEMLPVYVILLAPDYHVPFANRFFRERFGDSDGKRCYEYLFNRTEPCENCETYKVLKTNAPHHWEWTGPDHRDYDINDFPFTDIDGSKLILEVGVDVTEQKRAQAALRKAHAELEINVKERTRELEETRDYLDNLFNYANAPIIVWNPYFEITRFNRAFERLTGRKAEEVIGGKIDILFPDDSHDESMRHIHQATYGERWETVEIPIKHKDGTERILLWNSANLYAQDEKTVIATIAQGQDITERKHAEDALKESEDLLHAFFESPGVMRGIQEIVDDTTVRHITDNRAKADFLGVSPESLRNKLSTELGETAEVMRTWVKYYRQSLKTGKPANFEYLDQREDRQTWLSATVSYLRDSLSGQSQFAYAILDVTQRKQGEEDLRETRDYLDNLFNYANAPIIVWNPDFEITRFNHAFERITGLRSEEVMGVKLDILFPDDSREQSMKHIYEATSGERWEVVEIPIQHKDGTARILLWNSANLYAADGKSVIATIAQGQDITERKRAEQMKDEFIGLVSHELRTPMTIITGSLRTAMSEHISNQDKDTLLQNAIEGADSLSAILENLLELSRYQAGRLQLHTEAVNIPNAARGVIERLKPRAEDRKFLVEFPDDLPAVKADPMRVERILYNLLENAVKYSPETSVIRVFARKEKRMVVTGVADKGIGMSQEDQSRIFELFERLGRGAKSQGLGLGLVVCKRLVDAQGGQIRVESKPDKGSTFYFTLPLIE